MSKLAGRPAAVLAAALLGGAVLALAGCRSAPPAVNDPAVLALLPPNAASYFFLNVRDNKALIRSFVRQAGADPSSLEPAIDRTLYLYGAFESSTPGAAGRSADAAARSPGNIVGKPPTMYLIGVGAYPGFLFGVGLSRSGQWRKLETTVDGRSREYWQQKGGTLELALSDKGQLLASTGDIRTLFMREERGLLEVTVPGQVTRQYPFNAAVLYAPAGAESASARRGISLPGAGSLPVDNLLLLVAPADGRYSLELSFDARSEREARTLSVVVKLSAVAILGSVGRPASEVMSSLRVTTSGRTLTAAGITLTGDELAALVFQLVGSSGIT